MAPSGKTSLVLELFCDAGDGMWQRSDPELIDLVVRDLAERLNFVRPSEVSDGFVVRSKDAYPRYSLGYAGAVSCIKNSLAGLDNLTIAGRGGTFRYNNTDHAIETGLLAARRALGESVNLEAVNSEQAYLEERRVRAGANWMSQPAASTH